MPRSISHSLRDATETLAGAGVESPAREALALVVWATGLLTAQALAYPERELNADEQARLDGAMQRRARREPLAYITGRVEFFGLELMVDARVIVPRPETEHVVEQALGIAREVEATHALPLLADIGAGSGCIGVALAHSLDRALVYAVDSSRGALEVAAANAQRHHVERRMRFLHGDLLSPLPQPVHIIASNPPYIARREFPTLMPEVRDYEPRAALDGGEEGLDVIRRLVEAAPGYLLSDGALIMEIGSSQGGAVLEMAARGFRAPRIERDLAGLDRVLVAHRRM
jgi:release factor glutamine methyltransferase